MVLTAYVVLSPVTGLFCHRRQRIKFCLSPVGPTQLRELDASVGASGPHDFAVREKRLSSARRGIAQESFDSPCDPIARKTLPRPPHPHPASVTIMIRPLCPQNLPECANGRFSQNRPLLELSPLRPKGGRACNQSEGQLRWSSSTRTVARASSPNPARKGVDDGTKRSRCRRY